MVQVIRTNFSLSFVVLNLMVQLYKPSSACLDVYGHHCQCHDIVQTHFLCLDIKINMHHLSTLSHLFEVGDLYNERIWFTIVCLSLRKYSDQPSSESFSVYDPVKLRNDMVRKTIKVK